MKIQDAKRNAKREKNIWYLSLYEREKKEYTWTKSIVSTIAAKNIVHILFRHTQSSPNWVFGVNHKLCRPGFSFSFSALLSFHSIESILFFVRLLATFFGHITRSVCRYVHVIRSMIVSPLFKWSSTFWRYQFVSSYSERFFFVAAGAFFLTAENEFLQKIR